MLLLAYWDGASILPLDFSLHREKGNNKKKSYGLTYKQLRQQKRNKRDKNTPCAKRVKELDKKKTNTFVYMFKRAVKHGFIANYLLLDSWFVNYEILKAVTSIKQGSMHLLGMVKMGKAKYKSDTGKNYTAADLKRINRKKQQRSRKLKAKYIELIVYFKEIRVKLFFVKYNSTNKWRLIITTNLSLSFTKAMEIYQIRWGIEVLFKEAKQYLHLGKSQSTNFDAQIADTTISLIQYIVLSLYKQITNQQTTIGIFRDSYKNFVEYSLAEILWGLFIALQNKIAELLQIDITYIFKKLINDKEMADLLRTLINLDQDVFNGVDNQSNAA